MERPTLVGDVAIAHVDVMQFSFYPATAAIVARGKKRGPLQAKVFACSNIRSGRKNLTNVTAESSVGVDHTLGAAVGILQKGWRLMAVIALADCMKRAALHVDVPAGLSVRTDRPERSGWAGGASGTSKLAVIVGDTWAALFIIRELSGVLFALFVLTFGVKRSLFYGDITARLLVRARRIALLRSRRIACQPQ